jgi:hypothetical protein
MSTSAEELRPSLRDAVALTTLLAGAKAAGTPEEEVRAFARQRLDERGVDLVLDLTGLLARSLAFGAECVNVSENVTTESGEQATVLALLQQLAAALERAG